MITASPSASATLTPYRPHAERPSAALSRHLGQHRIWIGRVFLIGMLIVLPSGCSQRNADRSLVVALNAGTEGDALQLAAREWAADREVEVETVVLPYNSLFEKELLDLTSGTSAYDILLIDDPWFPVLAADGKLVALDRHLAQRGIELDDSDFIRSCLDACRYPAPTGPYLALPYVGNTQLFFYRSDLFEKHGLDVPQTWAEVLHAAQVISEGEGIYGYVMRAAAGNAVVSAFMPLLWAFGGDMFDQEGRPIVASGEAAAALEFMLELGKYSPPGYAGMNADEVAAHLLQATAPMSVNWPSWISAMDDPNKSKVAGRIAFAPMPSAKRRGSPMLGVWLLAVSARTDDLDLAIDFLVWATAPAQMKKAAMRGSPPTRRGVFADPDLRARFRAYPVQLASLEAARARYRTKYWNEIENVYGIYLSQAHAGTLPPKEALRRANRAIEAILER